MDNNLFDVFGLTAEQTFIMYSIQSAIIGNDCDIEKNAELKAYKTKWKQAWEKAIKEQLNRYSLISQSNIFAFLRAEIDKQDDDLWLYILILQCIAFAPYTPLDENDFKNNTYKKCKLNEKEAHSYIKNILKNTDRISDYIVDVLYNSYSKNIDIISNKKERIAHKVLSTMAVVGIGAIVPIIAVGPILALAGEGIILGASVKGAAGVTSLLIFSSPDFALMQIAELDTLVKEVVLNLQKDILLAQKIIVQFENQLVEMKKKLVEIEVKDKDNKKAISDLKESIEYLKSAYNDLKKYSSSFEAKLASSN